MLFWLFVEHTSLAANSQNKFEEMRLFKLKNIIQSLRLLKIHYK